MSTTHPASITIVPASIPIKNSLINIVCAGTNYKIMIQLSTQMFSKYMLIDFGKPCFNFFGFKKECSYTPFSVSLKKLRVVYRNSSL